VRVDEAWIGTESLHELVALGLAKLKSQCVHNEELSKRSGAFDAAVSS
jgi:hypothetical protein